MAKADSTGGASRTALSNGVAPTGYKGEAATAALQRLKAEACGCWGIEYFGTAADLVAAGLVQSHQFPAKARTASYYRGRPIVRADYSKVPRDEHYMSVRSTGRRFRAIVGLPQEEQDRLYAEEAAAFERQQRAVEAECDAANRSDLVAFRESARTIAEALQSFIANHTPGDHDKDAPSMYCRFSARGVEDVLDALHEVRDWLDAAEVFPVTKAPKPAQEVSAARADKSFQSFLESQCLKD
jgi:hypothetical protein